MFELANALRTGVFDHGQVRALVDRFFDQLHRPVRKNLTQMVEACITLTAALRSGHGALTLAALARALPHPSRFKHRYKQVNRFLDNRLFDPQGMTEGLFGVLVGIVNAGTMLSVVLDQSSIGAAQILLAGIPYAGRILPLALMTFTYADIQTRPDREKSQNFIERLFFLRLLDAAPEKLRLCFILDRGYARVSLIRELLTFPQACFILRAKGSVGIEHFKRGRWRRMSIRDLKRPHGRPRRLERVRYRRIDPIEVDLVLFYEPGYKEPWYLVVPPGSAEFLPTEVVVERYRRRMQIEQGFRDFKTHLGVRGLKLQVRISERIQRLLMAFTLAYALIVALGTTPLGEDARSRLETPRPSARHGTTRILSARTVAALLIAGLCPERLTQLTITIARMLEHTLAEHGLYYLALGP